MGEQDRVFAALAQGRTLLERDQLELCRREGVVPLITRVSPDIEADVREEVHRAVAVELTHRHAVAPVLEALAEARIDALVLKGSALAYSLYEKPWQRLRNDTDLLIRPQDYVAVKVVLERFGFELVIPAIGHVAQGEESYYRTDESGLTQCIDLHWRFSNLWTLASRFEFDALWASRQPVDSLAAGACRCSDANALMIACLHRIGHVKFLAYEKDDFRRWESDFTLWVHDIHLLASRLDDDEWDMLLRESVESGVAPLVLDGLERAKALFETSLPSRVVSILSVTRGQMKIDDFRGMIRPDWLSFLAVPVRQKPHFLLERMFPSRAHMDARYGTDVPLIWRYVKRWLAGIRRRLPWVPSA